MDREVRTGKIIRSESYIHIFENIPVVGAAVGPHVGFVGEIVGAADGRYVGTTVM